MGLKNERFGIVSYSNSAATILPLTNSYTYALQVLDGIYEDSELLTTYYDDTFLKEGTQNKGVNGKIFNGDGLASCAMSFKNDEKRTKIVILLTRAYGLWEDGSYINVLEAGDICKDAGIVVYPITFIDGSHCQNDFIPDYIELANKTGGKFYDLRKFSSKDVVSEINSLSKSMLKKNSSTSKIDVPELIFQYLVIITGIMFVADWRIRL